jgi:hypothetical protein
MLPRRGDVMNGGDPEQRAMLSSFVRKESNSIRVKRNTNARDRRRHAKYTALLCDVYRNHAPHLVPRAGEILDLYLVKHGQAEAEEEFLLKEQRKYGAVPALFKARPLPKVHSTGGGAGGADMTTTQGGGDFAESEEQKRKRRKEDAKRKVDSAQLPGAMAARAARVEAKQRRLAESRLASDAAKREHETKQRMAKPAPAPTKLPDQQMALAPSARTQLLQSAPVVQLAVKSSSSSNSKDGRGRGYEEDQVFFVYIDR